MKRFRKLHLLDKTSLNSYASKALLGFQEKNQFAPSNYILGNNATINKQVCFTPNECTNNSILIMPHKISIQKLGPIKKIEKLEIKNYNLIIGKSASGKSILAKAVMLFNDSRFLDQILFKEGNKAKFREYLEHSFIELYFPEYKNFSISYFYDNDISLTVKVNNTIFEVGFSETLKKKRDNLLQEISEIRKNNKIKEIIEELDEETYSELLELINQKEVPTSVSGVKKAFLNTLNVYNTIFIPATRSFVSDFDDFRLTELDNQLFNHYHRVKTDIGLQLFSEVYRNLSRNFSNFDSAGYKKLMKGNVYQKKKTPRHSEIYMEIEGDNIGITQWSSGQKEMFPILLILHSIHTTNEQSLIIIEEPESHLFPEDQRSIFETIIEVIKKSNSKVIITTHSPYMLMVANNLIEANRKNYKKLENMYLAIEEIDVSKIEKGEVASLIDNESQLIDADYIESVAENICENFDEIIHS